MITEIITFTLVNFLPVCLALALLMIFFKFRSLPKGAKTIDKLDIAIRYLVFWCFGVLGVYGFIFHIFFPGSSEYIGWAPSPFQFEVGMGNLALAITGVYCLWRKKDFSFWLATTIFCATFYLGAAYGHVKQIIIADNWSPDNAGSMLWFEILVSLLIMYLLCKYKRQKNN